MKNDRTNVVFQFIDIFDVGHVVHVVHVVHVFVGVLRRRREFVVVGVRGVVVDVAQRERFGGELLAVRALFRCCAVALLRCVCVQYSRLHVLCGTALL